MRYCDTDDSVSAVFSILQDVAGLSFDAEVERENFISQVRHQITSSTIIIDYNGRLPEKADTHQRWPPLTE